MTGKRISPLAIAVLTLAGQAFGADVSPYEILEAVAAKYKEMQTYKANGTITANIDTHGMKMETSFSILLKKPNLYLISWTQENMPLPRMVQSGAVWSDGTQPYLYMGVMNAYFKMDSDELALGGATGISRGSAFTVPSLFLPGLRHQTASFLRLKNPQIGKNEEVGEEDCYVISGPSVISKKETFWISTSRHVIKKYYRSLEPPEGGLQMPEMTDEQLEEAIEQMGEEVTEESKRNLRETIERSTTALKNQKMKGSLVELHEQISSPELDKSDFTFSLPEGTVLKDFDEVIGGAGGDL